MRNLVLSAFAAGALLASPAQAATVSFSDALALQDVEISGTLSVPQFDPSLGTLTGVTFTITGAIASILGVTNSGTNVITGAATTTVDFNVSSSALSLPGMPDFSVVGSTGLVTLGVGESALFPVTGMNSISGSPAPSAAFIGGGTVDLDFMTTTSFGGSGFGGDIIISQATDAGLMFQIEYEFDAVAIPLPATAPLLAAAAGLFLFVGRRRARRLS
ncbi:MAG: choice-of-anchor E domain-containing protein [Pikeienuella sp.]|uniref:choice-of-anchor E domain-containing protein n=1 Tax=Pikeienuella sp. TaxID=2831957 RepID=UPI0039188171